ncbi:MAG: class I SAM-dependent methyltransferase [bacterium]
MKNDLPYTGECAIVGSTPKEIEEEHLERYRFAIPFVREKRVLDCACGSGYGSRMLLDGGARSVVGVDLREDAIDYARERYQKDDIEFAVGDATTYSSAEPFDVIVSFETIEHVQDYQQALVNFALLMHPGGCLLLSTPNRKITSPDAHSLHDKPKNPFHAREFLLADLLAALRVAGFYVGSNDIYGQRQQPMIPGRFLREIYRRFARPYRRLSPSVTPCVNRDPMYYVLVATKGTGKE